MSTALHDILNSLSPGFEKEAERDLAFIGVLSAVKRLEEETRVSPATADEKLFVFEAICRLDAILHGSAK